MTHAHLHARLAGMGWRREVRAGGRVDHYLSDGPLDRMVATAPTAPAHALCETRGGGRGMTSVEDAAAWARECMPR